MARASYENLSSVTLFSAALSGKGLLAEKKAVPSFSPVEEC